MNWTKLFIDMWSSQWKPWLNNEMSHVMAVYILVGGALDQSVTIFLAN